MSYRKKRSQLNSHSENLTKIVERIRSLIEDYKVIKSDLNYYTLKLERMYHDDDSSPNLYDLYDLEDKQFSKCIDAVCVYQDIVSLYNRIDEVDENKFMLKLLEKEISELDVIETHFYFDYIEQRDKEDKNE